MEDKLVDRVVDMLEEKVERREMWKTCVNYPPTIERRVTELTVEIDLLKTLLKGIR